ncbi:LysR family transcriptional regulator [Gordonibacter pamelaeae]
MDIAHLRYFKHLAECESYTKAARISYVTQPALSSAVRSLERELGFYLIEKNKPGFSLTEAGRAFYEAVSRSLDDIDRVVADCRAQAADSSTIEAGIASSEFVSGLFDAICELAERELPEARLRMVKMAEGELPGALRSGGIDIAFAMQELEDDALTCTKAMSCCLAACVPECCDLARASVLSAADLASRNLFTYHRETPMGRRIASWVERNNLHAIFDFEDEATLTSMVRANRRSIALVAIPQRSSAAANGLRFVPIEESKGSLFLYAVQRKDYPTGSPAALRKSKLALKNLGLSS